MKDIVFKVVMSYLEASVKESVSKEDILKIKKLIDSIKGEHREEDLPEIESSDDFYEAARTLGLNKYDFPKVIVDILRSSDTLKLPRDLIGDIGEYLGEKKGLGVMPTSLLERFFYNEYLDKKVSPTQWEYFFKDEKKLKEFKKEKGI